MTCHASARHCYSVGSAIAVSRGQRSNATIIKGQQLLLHRRFPLPRLLHLLPSLPPPLSSEHAICLIWPLPKLSSSTPRDILGQDENKSLITNRQPGGV